MQSKRSSFGARFLVPMVALLLFGSCSSGGAGRSFDQDQEWQLGREMSPLVAQRLHLVNDPGALAYLRSAGERIHAQSSTALITHPFEFEIIDDPLVYAFQLPGGHVYVTRGLITQADKADMLAAVLGHEIGHASARHLIKHIEQAHSPDALNRILAGQNAADLQSILDEILAGGPVARFTSAEEKEADDQSFKPIVAAGFDPHGTTEMLEKLQSLQKSNPALVSRFLTAHPLAPERIADLQGRIGKLTKNAGVADEPEYQAARRRLGGS